MTFADPDRLWLLISLGPLALLAYRSGLRARAVTAAWGVTDSPARWLSGCAEFLALALILITCAGPQWGESDSAGILKGRDLVILLDLSKSMAAADMADSKRPERWQAGREGIVELLNDLKRKGGHRVALVAFAAKPRLLCPLTVDYDFALRTLDDLSVAAPPAGLYPDEDEPWSSGTRIGAAIRAAVAAHDANFAGYQDCLLISDGDDPAADRDSEIETGTAEAAQASVPVHTVGLGDAKEGGQIFVDERPLQTRLEEASLKMIARRTDGLYLSAGRSAPELTAFFREKLEPRPSRELPDDLLPQPQERRIWFVLPAIALLALAWVRE